LVFSSHVFIYYFLPLSLLVYYGLIALCPRSQRMRNGALAILGYIFYGWSEPKFVLLMFATTLIDWILSLVIAGQSLRFWRVWRQPAPLNPLPKGSMRSGLQHSAIVISVVSNLGMLAFFKYSNMAVNTVNAVTGSSINWPAVLLPLGISFYTFQSLSYIIDVFRGDARPMRSFVDFACFVSMFPHLVAGPILKFKFLAPQLERRAVTLDKSARGAAFFMMGLAKKILVANQCAVIADQCFNAGSRWSVDAWWGVVAYTFQIYFDFSGYSDMAIGLGLILGFVFARNFDHPYRSESITEFWRRWHISLSTWLRDYLYVPLGGNRRGKIRTYINLILTMLLGGLWHGAAWQFVIWGGIHGAMLALERAAGKTGLLTRVPYVLRVLVTFVTVMVAWVFFRANGLTAAGHYLADMVGTRHPQAAAGLLAGTIYTPVALATMAVAAVCVWALPDTWEFTQPLSLSRAVFCCTLFLLSLLILTTQSYNPFIYFRF
jgi:alginate O-acetyltransferase complex protein AlgI